MELSDIAIFVRVVQAGSFTEAARRSGIPKSTASAKVLGLEKRLGVTLLQRTTRKLHLTDEGAAFFHTCARALSELEAAEALATSGQKRPQGRVSMTAPNDSGRLLAKFLKTFLATYPGITVELILTNRYVDLVGEGVDVAIRAGELQDSTLIARKVSTTQRVLIASPRYLASAGMPQQPKELTGHQCILFSSTKSDRWQLRRGHQRADIKVSGAVSADDITALKELAVQDLGVALVPSFLCREDLAAKRLTPVLPEWASDSSPICVVYPAQKFQHPKIRVFVDELVKMLERAYRG